MSSRRQDGPKRARWRGPAQDLGDVRDVYSDYETDGAGQGPKDFASEDEVERADDDAKEAEEAIEANTPDDDNDDGGKDKPGKGPKSRAAKK